MAPNLRTSTGRAARTRQSERERRHSGLATDSGNETDQYEEVEWEVDQVVGKRFGPEGEPSYLLKWKDWEGDATWEPAENCQGCLRLVNEYESRISGPSGSSASGRGESSARTGRDDQSSRQSSSTNRSKVTPKRK